MNIQCKERVPIAKTKHHYLVFFVTDFNPEERVVEHRKTKDLWLNSEKTNNLRIKRTQEKSSPSMDVCRFHEFLPVGPYRAVNFSSYIETFFIHLDEKKGVDDALIQPYLGHDSRQSLEMYSKLSLGECQPEYEKRIKDFPI